MAVKNLFANAGETFKVISTKDDALASDFSAEEYADYLKDLDESKLRRREDCADSFTYFHLRLVSKIEDALRNKDKLASLGMRPGSNQDQPLFTVMTRIVETSLVDITCDGVSCFEKADKHGGPSDRLLVGLVQSLIIVDLFSAIQAREAGPMSGPALEMTKKN